MWEVGEVFRLVRCPGGCIGEDEVGKEYEIVRICSTEECPYVLKPLPRTLEYRPVWYVSDDFLKAWFEQVNMVEDFELELSV